MEIPPFNAYLGSQVIRKQDGEAEVVLDLLPHHLNRRGVAHGGVVSALLDSALGAAVISSIPEQWWCATTTLNTQFIAGVGEGRLRATGRLLRRGSNVAFASGEVRDRHGKLVASATGTWHLWPTKPGTGLPDSPPKGTVTFGDDGRRVSVGKILAVGRNYADHVVEMGAPRSAPPVLFFKPSTALAGDGDEIVLPRGAGEVHHEVELVVVIGRGGRAITKQTALDHVAGYAVGLDLTLRELQSRAKQRGEPWSLSKGFDGSAPVSVAVERDRVGDGSGLEIRLEVNGETRQAGNTSRMLYGVAELIELASRWVTLEPGDLLFTGTPAGVGPARPGDRIVARLENVGTLSIFVR